MLIKIGDRVLRLNGFNLEPTENIEGETTDHTELATKTAGQPLEVIKHVYEEKVAAYEQAKKEGNLTQQKQLRTEIAVIGSTHQQAKQEAQAAEEENSLEIPELETEETIEETDETTQETENVETKTDDSVDNSAASVDNSVDDVLVNEEPELTDEQKLALTKADAIIKANEAENESETVTASSNRGKGVRWVRDTVFNRLSGDGFVERDTADFVSASSGDVFEGSRGADADIAAKISDMVSSYEMSKMPKARQGQHVEPTREVLGVYKTNTGAPIASGIGKQTPNDNFVRGNPGGRNLVMASSGELCEMDERKDIPDCSFEGEILDTAVEEYPMPNCQLYYRAEMPTEDYWDGIGMWTEEDKQATCDAQDLLKEGQIEGDQDKILEAMATLQMTAKSACTTSKCATMKGPIKPDAIYTCSSTSIENAECNPEMVQLMRERLGRLLVRYLNGHFLMNLKKWSYKFNADASKYVNGDSMALDASVVLEIMLTQISCYAEMASRMSGTDYTLVIQRDLMKILALGNNMSTVQRTINDLRSYYSDFNLMVTPDYPATQGPNGLIIPTTVDAGYLPLPELDDQGMPPADTLELCDAVQWPSNMQIGLVPLGDFFKVSRGEISLSAEITHDSIKHNMMSNEFYETFQGYGKDGCNPSYWLDFNGYCVNGARVGTIAPFCINGLGGGEAPAPDVAVNPLQAAEAPVKPAANEAKPAPAKAAAAKVAENTSK